MSKPLWKRLSDPFPLGWNPQVGDAVVVPYKGASWAKVLIVNRMFVLVSLPISRFTGQVKQRFRVQDIRPLASMANWNFDKAADVHLEG